jgi:hypothetical protein
MEKLDAVRVTVALPRTVLARFGGALDQPGGLQDAEVIDLPFKSPRRDPSGM